MTPFETRLDLPYTDASHQPGIVIFSTVQNNDTKGLYPFDSLEQFVVHEDNNQKIS